MSIRDGKIYGRTDIEKDCNDWGTKLDRQTLGDSSQDENKSNPIIQERAFLRREGALFIFL